MIPALLRRSFALSRVEHAGVQLIKVAMWASEGYALPFTAELIRMHGLAGFVDIVRTYKRIVAVLVARFGAPDAHALLGFAAHWNGCGYISAGHVFASNLLRFRDEGALFPIDQDELERLSHRSDEDAQARVRELLEPAFGRTLSLLTRQLALKLGTAEGETEDDPYLSLCNAAVDWTNEHSIVVGVDADLHAVSPLDEVAKDDALRHRYEAARQAERKRIAAERAAKAGTAGR